MTKVLITLPHDADRSAKIVLRSTFSGRDSAAVECKPGQQVEAEFSDTGHLVVLPQEPNGAIAETGNLGDAVDLDAPAEVGTFKNF